MNDIDLQKLVIEELAFDPRVDSASIAVAGLDGVVTLRGTIRSLTEKWQAIEDVKSVRGVVGIADELVVELPAEHLRSDTDIARAVAMRLESNAMVPEAVRFVVTRGEVTLSGEVAWNFQRDEAVREVRGVTGVLSIRNQIAIAPAPVPSVEDVRRRIQSVFARTADSDANRVRVSVDRSTVTLRGKVRSWLEHDIATQAAWNMRGVTRVENRLEVGS
jgi:osmotically-inducible protein OsmY